jgi:hypothetical protein
MYGFWLPPFGIFKLFLLPQYNIYCHVFVPVANQDLDFQRDMSWSFCVHDLKWEVVNCFVDICFPSLFKLSSYNKLIDKIMMPARKNTNKLLWLKHIELQIPDDVEEALYLDLSVKRLSTEEKKSTQLHARRRITLILRYG